MKVIVYHRDNFDPREESGFSRVAIVDAPTEDTEEALEYAFRWTNNINGSWSLGSLIDNNPDSNDNVCFVGEYRISKDGRRLGARSTSVRDVMYTPDGKYEVAGFGFDKVA